METSVCRGQIKEELNKAKPKGQTSKALSSSRLKVLLSAGCSKLDKQKKLKKRLEKMTIKNESLTKLIKQKNCELLELKKSTEGLSHILNALPNESVLISPVNFRLVEANSKNRKLNVELVNTKSQLNKKDMEIKKKESDMKIMEEKLKKVTSVDKSSNSTITALAKHITDLRGLITKMELKNKELSGNLSAAIKCLQQETGHKWDLDEFISNPTNWRGRALKIKHLESEISLYSEQLESYKKLLSIDNEAMARKNGGDDKLPNMMTSDVISSTRIKGLELENSSLKKNLEKQNAKILSLRVRNEALNEEVIKCRTLIGSMEQRAELNVKKISTLNGLAVQKQNNLNRQVAEIKQLRRQLEKARYEENSAKERVKDLEANGGDKFGNSEKLLEENEKLRNDLKSFCGGFLFSCRDLRKEEFVGALAALETEKELLLKRISELDRSLEQERLQNLQLTKELNEQLIRVANFECQLEYTLKNQNCNKKNNGQKSSRSLKNSCDPCPKVQNNSKELEFLSKKELQMRLQIAESTINKLNQKLDNLAEELRSKSKAFQEMVSQSKGKILETIQEYRHCT